MHRRVGTWLGAHALGDEDVTACVLTLWNSIKRAGSESVDETCREGWRQTGMPQAPQLQSSRPPPPTLALR